MTIQATINSSSRLRCIRTGIFVLENDQAIFRTHTPYRTNYWSEWAQILHGCSFWQSIWGYRGVFRNSAQEPRYGVPLGGPPPRPKNLKKIFFAKFQFFGRNGSYEVRFDRIEHH